MKLTVLSDYGSKVKVISPHTSHCEITETMKSIDWNEFHQVVLTMDDDNWLEVGGNITDDGLSVVYREYGVQYITVKPPETVYK